MSGYGTLHAVILEGGGGDGYYCLPCVKDWIEQGDSRIAFSYLKGSEISREVYVAWLLENYDVDQLLRYGYIQIAGMTGGLREGQYWEQERLDRSCCDGCRKALNRYCTDY